MSLDQSRTLLNFHDFIKHSRFLCNLTANKRQTGYQMSDSIHRRVWISHLFRLYFESKSRGCVHLTLNTCHYSIIILYSTNTYVAGKIHDNFQLQGHFFCLSDCFVLLQFSSLQKNFFFYFTSVLRYFWKPKKKISEKFYGL